MSNEQEITWQDFRNYYLETGRVERLVVNEKAKTVKVYTRTPQQREREMSFRDDARLTEFGEPGSAERSARPGEVADCDGCVGRLVVYPCNTAFLLQCADLGV